MNNKTAIICCTPYQLYNIICLLNKNTIQTIGICDIYIAYPVANEMLLKKKLTDLKIARKVFIIRCHATEIFPLSLLETLYRMIFSKKFLSRQMEKGFLENYNNIMVACTEKICLYFLLAYPESRVLLFDDGLGSYVTKYLYDNVSNNLRRFMKLFKRSIINRRPYMAFLNVPNMVIANPAEEIFKINRSAEDYALLCNIFGYKKNEVYKKNVFVYLTQPINEISQKCNEIENNIIGILDANSFVIREHPRAKFTSKTLANGCIDDSGNVWELECFEQIDDNNVLISFFSTAQFSPNMLYGKEPYIIFLYRLLDENGLSKTPKEWHSLVQQLKNQYNDPKKIYVPQSYDEFKKFCENIITLNHVGIKNAKKEPESEF